MLHYIAIQDLVQTQFSKADIACIMECRGEHNRLGFAYHLAFVKLLNRFPDTNPLEVIDDVLSYVSVQLSIEERHIYQHGNRQPTVAAHQDAIRHYLSLRSFNTATTEVETYLFKEAYHLEQSAALTSQLKNFLRTNSILEPAQDTMSRLIQTQREAARVAIYDKITREITNDTRHRLDGLLDSNSAIYSPLYYLKKPPGNPSPASFIKLTETLDLIKKTEILSLDMDWLNNNFQRSLARYARKCSVYRLKRLKQERRYAVLICFLCQLYQDTFDAAVQMHDKLMNKMFNKADKEIDHYMKGRQKHIRSSLSHYKDILGVLLDEGIAQEDIRSTVFKTIKSDTLQAELDAIEDMLGNQYSNSFKRVIARHSYMRQFSPALIKHIRFQVDTQDKTSDDIIKAVALLNRMNEEGTHKLPKGAPTGFIPKKWHPFVFQDNKLHKPAWECALLAVLRNQVKSGNLFVPNSKRFASLDTFFIPEAEWASKREAFFARAGLPMNPDDVPAYLTNRLNNAYDRFLEKLPTNSYAQLNEEGWQISSDPTEKLDYGTDTSLNPLKKWIGQHIRTIKLSALLIEVDNDLKFSRFFMSAAHQENPTPQHICEILATHMAHACEIGPYTMAQLVEGITYDRMKHITYWHMHEEAQRAGLAEIVNAISQLDITKYWGDGTTSSSDGQRFSLRRKVLHKSYSHAFNDFALEFYRFVADNYAPFFSTPHECADRDAPFVLDGILYNESDLNIGEHYTDTHGFTDTNFAAFAMFGKRFIPRIKGLQKQAIFRIDTEKDYGAISVLLKKKDRILHPEWIAAEWDRMGHFYASLESGHVTASTALKRLNGFSGKNHFFRANREFGRLIRTEHTLNFMSDPDMRKRNRRGLLKGEQVNALARDLKYGHRGRLNSREWEEQKKSCSSLNLVIACIIYWQAKEIHRVIKAHAPPEHIDLALLKNISPVSWENVIVYGDYVLNKDTVQS
ncbi:MAG: Tn3 family transposase [Rhizobiales bacterium]|nr:Tn3 family transposase [Hyphomicrobiales bacterium]